MILRQKLQNRTGIIFRDLHQLRKDQGVLVSQLRQILIDRHISAVFDNVDRAVQRAQRRLAHFQNAVTLVERGHLTEDLLDSTQLQDILLHLHSRHMPLSWYYTYTPVQLVKVNKTELIFKFELWGRLNNIYDEWDLQVFPTCDSTFATQANIRSPVVTDAKRKTLFLPTDCRGVKVKLCAISRLEKTACELVKVGQEILAMLKLPRVIYRCPLNITVQMNG